MQYEQFFQAGLDGLKRQGNYRRFAELERRAGQLPRATLHEGDTSREVTVWCLSLIHISEPTRPY